MRRQSSYLLGIFFAIASTDQLAKAWAWRHLIDVHVNSGGDLLVGAGISAWFRDPVRGAMFDVVDAGLLSAALLVLARRRRPVPVLVPAAVVLAGWSSNLLDRLGLHHLTAPGSVRGVVDFVPWHGRYWNVADLAIIGGSGGLVVALLALGARTLVRPRSPRTAVARRPALATVRARLTAVAGIATASVLAAVGAITYAGVSGPVELLAAGR